MSDPTPCEFVPAHEPWTCEVHDGIRTRLDEPLCDVARPAAPLNEAELANVRAAQPRVGRYLIRRLLANLAAVLAATPEPTLDAERLDRAMAAKGIHIDLRRDPPRPVGCGSCKPAMTAIAAEYARVLERSE